MQQSAARHGAVYKSLNILSRPWILTSSWVEDKSFKTERNDAAVYVIMTQNVHLWCSIYIQIGLSDLLWGFSDKCLNKLNLCVEQSFVQL